MGNVGVCVLCGLCGPSVGVFARFFLCGVVIVNH